MRQKPGRLYPWGAGVFLSAAFVAGCGGPRPAPDVAETPSRTSTPATDAPAAPNEFVGSAVCAECHADQHASYLQTAHSRSLSLVNPDAEPADGAFVHATSGRNYEVYRRDGQLRHREALLTEEGETIAQSDYPVAYLVGSGRHSRTYLSEIDGFLVESPITWYESRQAWDVSPGYDVPFPNGFERAADVGCLFCHVGSVEQVDGSLHRLRFHELAIGCEQCHGPGAEHVATVEGDRSAEDVAASITDPGDLSRDLREDLCAQCHLRGDATAYLPGTGPGDFRPGEPLTSVRVDFVVDSPNALMEVVGHVEQMRMSRCYTQSAELTCTTCHEMHGSGPESVTAEFYRARCLDCHAMDACGAEGARRAESQDDCIACHMPQSATDIPHIAFTHHRIGLHEPMATEASGRRPPRLVAYQDVSGMDPLVVQRLEGLAYLEIAASQPNERFFSHCYQQSTRLLEGVHQAGHSDGDLEAALAQLFLHTDPFRAARHADAALELESTSVKSRVNALLVRAMTAQRSGDLPAARAALEELRSVRRFAPDSIMLGTWLAPSNPQAALLEFQHAAAIQPFRPDVAAMLADVQARLGNSMEAGEHRRRAILLQEQLQRTNSAP